MKFYAGIGSRETPTHVLKLMHRFATYHAASHRLRSGGAQGADRAFESGAGHNADIYIPWRDFTGNPAHIVATSLKTFNEALRIAAAHHPAWHLCSQGARKLHARNVYQVLGSDLKTPSEFICMWAPSITYDAATGYVSSCSGGTGQAVRIARSYGIDVIDVTRV